MRRAINFTAIMGLFGAAALAAVIAFQAFGYTEYEVAALSGKAIMAAELRGRIEDVMTFYPPLPLFLSLPFAYFPSSSIPPAMLAAVLLSGLFAASLYYGFRGQGVSRWTAFAGALLLVLNPFSLYALSAGPSAMLLMAALLMLGFGLFGMAGEAAAPDAMMTGLALTLVAFSHPFGLVLVLASLPALALAAPPAILARTPGSLFLIFLFPVAFALFSFSYTRWALGAEPLTFLQAAFRAVPTPEGTLSVRLSRYLLEVVPSLIVTAPLLIAFPFWTKNRPSQFLPAAGLIGMVLLAGILQVLLQGHADTPLLLAAGLTAAGVCATGAARERAGAVLLLLCLGVLGGSLAAAGMAYRKGELSWPLAAAQTPGGANALGAALCGKKGVLVDTAAHPGIVQLCGTAEGLVVAGEPDFNIQVQSRRLTSPYVLVGPFVVAAELDRVAHTFPSLYEHGADGYARIHDGAGWRLYVRTEPTPTS
jgi:hypothetical protein